MLTIVCYGGLWVNKVSVRFLQQLNLKNKIKHRYSYTDLSLMVLLISYFIFFFKIGEEKFEIQKYLRKSQVDVSQVCKIVKHPKSTS